MANFFCSGKLSSAGSLWHSDVSEGSCPYEPMNRTTPNQVKHFVLMFFFSPLLCTSSPFSSTSYNGSLPQGDKGRRRSKFTLHQRPEPNGIKKHTHYVVQKPQMTRAIQDKGQHSISYTLSRNQAVIVEYASDEDTDMFQVGRSSENPIDFIVIDTPANDKLGNHLDQSKQSGDHSQLSQQQQQSTISRFACRILVDRKPPYTARIYAAGFDSLKNIFLGEKATKWEHNGEIDGLTTNGVLIRHPKVPFYLMKKEDNVNSNNKQADGKRLTNNNLDKCCKQSDQWREVSVCGSVYAIRETRSASTKGEKIENETNVLQDGSLIDLCGVTLIWRSAEGLRYSPTKRVLDEMIDEMNNARPLCPGKDCLSRHYSPLDAV